jgi:ankyrin repeat protein
MAVKYNLNSVQIFCKKGANEGTALHLTAIHNKSDVAEVLCRHNADVNA